MREIKFRAWDKVEKEFTTAFSINYKGEVAFQPKTIDKTYMTDSLVLQQYTGLKDKNGVEIYEGDVVKIVEDKNIKVANQPHDFKFGDIAKVEWSETNLAYYLVNENHESIECQMDYYGAWTEWNWLEIIGNIYENPELLKLCTQ